MMTTQIFLLITLTLTNFTKYVQYRIMIWRTLKKLTSLGNIKKLMKLHIWDTTGQEKFRSIIHSYYRSASGVVMVYDITKKASFDRLSQWLDDVKHYGDPNIVKVLIGNKQDLENMREVPFKEAKSYAQHHGMIDVLETSARENINIDEVFLKLAKELKRRHDTDVGGVECETPGSIKLKSRSIKIGWGCCGS